MELYSSCKRVITHKLVSHFAGQRLLRVFHVVLGLLLLSLTECDKLPGQVVLPKLQGVDYSQGLPQAPGESFSPPMSGSANPNAPICAEWTRTAGPGESLVITGSKFSNYQGAEEGKDTRFAIYGNNGLLEGNLQRLDGNKAIITLGSKTLNWGMYLIWPGNEAGYGQPIAVNKTEPWWIGPNVANRGKPVSVFGRNLSNNNDTLSSFVYILPDTGSGQWASVVKVNPYKVDFLVPSNFKNGHYTVWAHNGHGGDFGWGKPLDLVVADSVAWGSTIFNVRNYGATGNGATDDLRAIAQANQAAGQVPGSTVFFPAGTYMVSGTLSLKSNVRYQGVGRNSIIKCASNFSPNAWGLLNAQSAANICIENLDIDGNHAFAGKLTNPIYLRADRHITINNVRFIFPGFSVLDLNNSTYVNIFNSEIIGQHSFLGTCSQLFIDHCNFKLTNDAAMALHSWGGVGVSITNSTCQDYNNSDPGDGAGWGMGRFFVGNGIWGSNRFTYLEGNTTSDLTVRPLASDQNSGEQIMWEGSFTKWAGHISSATPTTLTLNSFNLDSSESRIVAIVEGKGLGQSRRIVGYNGSTIRLETPWNVIPDQTSLINIGDYADRIVVYKNYLDAKPYAASNQTHNASAGVEPFGGTFNLVVDGNTLHELRQGISNWVVKNPTDKGYQPNFFNVFTRNKISSCRWGIYNSFGNWSTQAGIEAETGMLGTIYRGNVIDNSLESAISNNIDSASFPVLNSMVFENNTITNAPNGFQSKSTGSANNLFLNNLFDGGVAGNRGFGVQTTTNGGYRNNKILHFSLDYSGDLNAAVIEAPQHVVEIHARSQDKAVHAQFVIWNSGTSPLQWVASETASWLSLTNTNGVIESQNDSSVLDLNVSIDNLNKGSYTAEIAIEAGLQREIYQVLLIIDDDLQVLPAKVLSFEGKLAFDFVNLFWETETQGNLRGFFVEKSLADGAHFKEIGFVEAPPDISGQQRFAFADPNSFSGVTYYRLKIVDLAGSMEYSRVIAVNGVAGKSAFNIFPNPSAGIINVTTYQPIAGRLKFVIFNLSAGSTEKEFIVEGTNGVSTHALNLKAMPPGTYGLKIIYPDKAEQVSTFIRM